MSNENFVAAGWYTDPGGQPVQRWWDGRAWSAQTRPFAPPVTSPPPQMVRVVAPPRPTSAASVITLILGVISVLGGFLLIFPVFVTWAVGHGALRETRDGQVAGHGMAVAGNVLAWVAFLPTVFWVMNLVFSL
jgi:hypothetical protein